MTDRDQAFRVWLAVGVAMLLVGLFFTAQTARFLSTARHAQGTIVLQESKWGSCPFAVTVEFTAGGRIVRFRECAEVYFYRDGQAVDVLYNPKNLGQATINSIWSLLNFWSLVLALGVVLCVGAFVLRRKAPQAPGTRRGTEGE